MGRGSAMTEFVYDGEHIVMEGFHTDDSIFDRIAKDNTFYEHQLLEKARSLGLKGVYVDIGANIGNHSIYFNRFCNSTKVYSFEIDETIFAILKNNLEHNCEEGTYHLEDIGILDKKGFVDLSDTNHLNAGMTKIVNVDGTARKVDTLDNVMQGVDNIALIKIDVEGFELQIIQGAQHILATQSPVIFAELATKDEFKQFKKAVAEFGYSTDMVNYAATPTYMFVKASIPVGTKVKQSAKRLYWGVKDKLTK